MRCALVWKLCKLTLTLFWQKFRESNGFNKGNTKQLIWRNFLQREQIYHFGKNFVKVKFLQKSLTKYIFWWTKFFIFFFVATFTLPAHRYLTKILWKQHFYKQKKLLNKEIISRNFSATILSQKFRQINFLLRKFTQNWFDEKKKIHSTIHCIAHSVWKCANFSPTIFL